MFATYFRTQMKNITTRIYHRYIQKLIRSERFSQRGDSCNSRKNFLEANKSWFTMLFFFTFSNLVWWFSERPIPILKAVFVLERY